MKLKTLVRCALCLFGMFAAPYFIIQPSFMMWVCADFLGTNVGDFIQLTGYAILGGFLVGLGSFFALMGRTIRSDWAIIVGLVYAPCLLFSLIYLLLPYLVPDL